MNPDNFFASAVTKKNKPGAGRPRKAPTIVLLKRIDWDKYDRVKAVLALIASDETKLRDTEGLLGLLP